VEDKRHSGIENIYVYFDEKARWGSNTSDTLNRMGIYTQPTQTRNTRGKNGERADQSSGPSPKIIQCDRARFRMRIATIMLNRPSGCPPIVESISGRYL
jgi:hypothetical protein